MQIFTLNFSSLKTGHIKNSLFLLHNVWGLY